MGYASRTNDEETRVGYVSRTNNGSGRVGYASRPGPMCIDCPMSGSSRSSDTNDGASVNIKNLQGNFCSRPGRDARHRVPPPDPGAARALPPYRGGGVGRAGPEPRFTGRLCLG